MKTEVVETTFNENPMFSIFKFNDDIAEEKPVVRFGIKKAQLIIKHLEELKEYVENNS